VLFCCGDILRKGVELAFQRSAMLGEDIEQRRADGAFTCIQKRSYGIELSVFYHQNYRGRREHLRQYGVVESVGKVFGLHPQCLEAECSGSGRQGCKSSR
jgi:hypothetical protein